MSTSDPDARTSLADLSAAGVHLSVADAVTIVHELTLQVARGELPGVPSAHVIRLSSSGAISIEGPVSASGASVSRAAQLLESLLPGFDPPAGQRVSGALRLVIVRALGALDLPPYSSLESFADALTRFVAEDPAAVVRNLVGRCVGAGSTSDRQKSTAVPTSTGKSDAAAADEPARARAERERADTLRTALIRIDASNLTVSDVRRARRATHLPLQEVSARSRIPVSLLRQLEWGYVRNWPTGLYGRTQLVRYARASGLDERAVVTAIWPLLEEAAREAERSATQAAKPTVVSNDIALIAVDDVEPVFADEVSGHDDGESQPVDVPVRARPGALTILDVEAPTVPHRKRTRVLAALTLAGATAAAVATAVWLRPELMNRLGPPTAQIARSEQAPPPPGTSTSPVVPENASPRPAARENRPVQAPVPDTPAVATSGIKPAELAMEPRTKIVPDVASEPGFASVGAAMFYQDATDADVSRSGGNARDAVLRIVRVVDENYRNFHARPSPDGSLIAFDSDREEQRAVYLANVDGTNVRRVSGEGFAAFPSWSPDGQSLAFVKADPDLPRVWNLWMVNLQSGHLRQLTAHHEGQLWGGSWFPDGRRIAYSLEDRLTVIDIVTGREHAYPSPRKGRLVRTPAVSPDGRLIVFQVADDGAWLLDVRDGSMRKVLADPSAEEYTWSPDGRRIAYHSRRTGDWGVWVMIGGQ